MGFEATAGFTADSDAPVSQNGVDSSSEWLKVIFNLIGGQTYADTVAALMGGVDLRIGIHVQAFGDGGSESFVNGPCVSDCGPPEPDEEEQTPEPALLALLGSGLVLSARRLRRRAG